MLEVRLALDRRDVGIELFALGFRRGRQAWRPRQFQSRSIVWLPMSPIWPAPKSQNMFHDRQFIPAPPEK